VGECSTVVCKDQGSNLTAGGSIWSVCQCLLATTVSWAKMAEMIKILFWVRTQVGPRNQGEGTIFFGGGRDIFWPIVKYWEYLACGQHCQPYLVGGSSNMVFCSCYCSNLLSWLILVLLCDNWKSMFNMQWSKFCVYNTLAEMTLSL